MSIGFSQSFPIELSIISRALRAHDANPKMSKKQIAEEIGLNKPKMDGISAWLRYFELWKYREGTLPVGKILLKYDEYFSLPGTQWILHYILTTNSSAEVWHFGFNQYFEKGYAFTRNAFYDKLLTEGIGVGTKYLTTDVGVLLNSYTVHEDAFTEIDIFSIDENNYLPTPPTEVPNLILAYALYRWRERLNGITTTSIHKLLNDEGQIGKIFLLSNNQIDSALRMLETLGLIRITKVADLDNITYTYDGNAIDLLERYYNETTS